MLDDNMTLDDAMPSTSRYLTKDDIGAGLQVQISRAEIVELDTDNGGKEAKMALIFTGHDKPLVLNQTNKELLKVATGATTLGGIKGKVINLYVRNDIEYRGKLVSGIRIAVPSNPPSAPPGPGVRQGGPQHTHVDPGPGLPQGNEPGTFEEPSY